jgi:hypothetical protein
MGTDYVVRFQVRPKNGPLPSVQAGSEPHLLVYPMGTGGRSGQGVKLITHPHLVPRLRMVGNRLLGCWPCGSCKNRRFGETYSLCHQVDKNRQARNVSSN